MKRNGTWRNRFLGVLLSVLIAVTAFPVSVLAAGTVAYIGDAGFSSLKAAVSAASPGATIIMVADDTSDQQITIEKSLTIELDGHSLPGTRFKITAGNVSIGDQKGTGTINSYGLIGFTASEISRCSASIYITGSASVTLNNLQVHYAADGGDLDKAVFLGGQGKLTINGGSYTGEKKAGVDAIFYYNSDAASSLTINDGSFEANCALSVNQTPGTGGKLIIYKATLIGSSTAFWIEGSGTINSEEKAKQFLADSSSSYFVGTFDPARIVIASDLFASPGYTAPLYGQHRSQ